MAPRLPCDLRVTRTKFQTLAADAAVVEVSAQPRGLILGCDVHLTQSIGTQEATLMLRNDGGQFAAWAPGDFILIEARSLKKGDPWVALLNGVAGNIRSRASSHGERVLEVPIRGWNFLLDKVIITTDKTYAANTKYTDIVSDLLSSYLPGVTASVTVDATTAGSFAVRSGQRVGDAVEACRQALRAATGTEWEYKVTASGSGGAVVKTFTFYKRGVTIQATLGLKDLVPGTHVARDSGDVLDIINKAKVVGASDGAAKQRDKTGLALTAYQRLDSTSKQAAQGFVADDTPLSVVGFRADRGAVFDPPTLNGKVARNSDNVDRIGTGMTRYGATSIKRNRAPDAGSMANIDDDNTGTDVQWNGLNGLGETELVVWDLGSSKKLAVVPHVEIASNASITYKLYGSTDDVTYSAALATWTSSTTFNYTVPAGAPVGPYRYYKLTVTVTVAATAGIKEFHLLEFDNLATDPTNPRNILTNIDGAVESLGTTGNSTKELCRFDFRSALQVAKVGLKHDWTAANTLAYLILQFSDDGAAWTNYQGLASSTGAPVDTIYVEEVSAHQYWRIVLQDDRAGGSANITVSGYYVQFYVHDSSAWYKPLIGDNLRASPHSWSVTDLVQHPGLLPDRTFAAPNVALVKSGYYWEVLSLTGTADATHYWDLAYGTEAAYLTAALKSTDGGVTWSSIAADAVLQGAFGYNLSGGITGNSDDAASQAKYANVVPSGIFSGGENDAALRTKTQVDNRASILTARRGDVRYRINCTVAFDPGIDVGNRVTLSQDLAEATGGIAGSDEDVVEVHHSIRPGDARTTLDLNEHPQSEDNALVLIARLAAKGTV